MRKRIEDWYRGRYVPPPPNDPNSSVVIMSMGHYEPHWTARTAQIVATFWLAHWQWVIGTMIAVTGLALAYSKL